MYPQSHPVFTLLPTYLKSMLRKLPAILTANCDSIIYTHMYFVLSNMPLGHLSVISTVVQRVDVVIQIYSRINCVDCLTQVSLLDTYDGAVLIVLA
jgi:hypothetical protein